ncbi:helix-turn-helix transcriptional regulator [uncultured Bacteroides sp.]|jgi:transcriptional regulator with XRE-family HTH domain|uniref:helix-turn-helix domain-containing protein n=1 Tax=uncultured Bacteroides sp. TaxID=162156 RepID=UPI0025895E3C|nr:helix-turn-helix transcriptional regulator [uncultured Bacteroides sp.]
MIRPDKLAQLIDERRIVKTKLCDELDISVMTLNNFLNKGSEIGSSKLERIADKFQVPIDYFYDREVEIDEKWHIGHNVNGNGNKVSGNISISEYQKEIEHLTQLLHEKQIIIDEKERTIQILLNKEKE